MDSDLGRRTVCLCDCDCRTVGRCDCGSVGVGLCDGVTVGLWLVDCSRDCGCGTVASAVGLWLWFERSFNVRYG